MVSPSFFDCLIHVRSKIDTSTVERFQIREKGDTLIELRAPTDAFAHNQGLLFHGFLHLEGHDDTRPVPWRAMKTAEFETMVMLI